MTRRALDSMSQRQLVYELRVAIDRARATARPAPRVLEDIAELVDANPRSIYSLHVQHNIGASRRAWLDDFVRGSRQFVSQQ